MLETKVTEVGPIGMITLRCKPLEKLEQALSGAGLSLPRQGSIVRDGAYAVGWMSPDELLLILPYTEVADRIKELQQSLVGKHFLAVDVSDSRVVFEVDGRSATAALSKLMPVDFAQMPEDGLRRSRAGQVAAAVWRHDAGYRLFCFRSVAGYMRDLLDHSTRDGSEIN